MRDTSGDGVIADGGLVRAARYIQRGEPSPGTRELHRWGGRQAEGFYRERRLYGKVMRRAHGVNCTGSCSWRVWGRTAALAQARCPLLRPGPRRRPHRRAHWSPACGPSCSASLGRGHHPDVGRPGACFGPLCRAAGGTPPPGRSLGPPSGLEGDLISLVFTRDIELGSVLSGKGCCHKRQAPALGANEEEGPS
jgi:hypothetical protein